MKWLLITILVPSFALSGWCTSSMKNACIANLKQIDGAVQQWALEHRLADTNRYSLTNAEIAGYLKGGVMPTCPSGGVYVAGRTVDGVPRCTLHGSQDTLEYWRSLDAELYGQMASNQLVLALEAVIVSGMILRILEKLIQEKRIKDRKTPLIVSIIMLIAALGSSLLRLFLMTDYRGPFFLWAPMLVFAFFGFAVAAKGVWKTQGCSLMMLCFAGLANVSLLLPILYGFLWGFRFVRIW